jgi:ParB-like chromosome segregation protein Spo0J
VGCRDFDDLHTRSRYQPLSSRKWGKCTSYEIGKGSSSLKLRLKGYLPVTCLEGTRNQRIAATIRHNRARGRHQITAMSEIVRELSQLGWDDNKIGKELGMDSDEVLRLKQINGLQELFADRQYSRAWTVK